MKEPNVAECVLGPVGAGERLPGLRRRDEAAGPGRPSVADAVVVERADPSVTAGAYESHGLHAITSMSPIPCGLLAVRD